MAQRSFHTDSVLSCHLDPEARFAAVVTGGQRGCRVRSRLRYRGTSKDGVTGLASAAEDSAAIRNERKPWDAK